MAPIICEEILCTHHSEKVGTIHSALRTAQTNRLTELILLLNKTHCAGSENRCGQ